MSKGTISDGTVDMGSEAAGQNGWTEVIQNTTNHMFDTHIQTPDIMSPDEFRGFWILTEYVNNRETLVIEVGKDGESEPFMTGIDANPLEIAYVGLSSWSGQAIFYF